MQKILKGLFWQTCGLLLFFTVVGMPVQTKADEAIRILFVGNSLTYRNNMPDMFQELAEGGGHEIYIETLGIGGCSLAKWSKRNTKPGSAFYKKLQSQNWDYVVLQDQSTRALVKPSSFKKAVKKLSKLIHEEGAEVVLNMTWAHEEGTRVYKKKRGLTQKKFQKKVYDLYTAAGEVNDALVANSGVAFLRCENYEDIDLYKDERHPSVEGSYLSACTLYTTIFQENVPELNVQVSKKTGKILRRIAEKVTFTSAGEM